MDKETPYMLNTVKNKDSCLMNGFWHVMDVLGGNAPTCRDNSLLFLSQDDWLTMVGGTRPSINSEQVHGFKFNLKEKKWHKIAIQ